MIEETIKDIQEQINMMKLDLLFAEQELDKLLDEELTQES